MYFLGRLYLLQRARPMSAAKKKQRNVLLDPADDQMLVEFCRRTNRDLPDTMRRIFRLFFQEGMEIASDRLNAGLWNTSARTPESSTGIPGDTPAERADYLLTGKQPSAPGKRKQKPA